MWHVALGSRDSCCGVQKILAFFKVAHEQNLKYWSAIEHFSKSEVNFLCIYHDHYRWRTSSDCLRNAHFLCSICTSCVVKAAESSWPFLSTMLATYILVHSSVFSSVCVSYALIAAFSLQLLLQCLYVCFSYSFVIFWVHVLRYATYMYLLLDFMGYRPVASVLIFRLFSRDPL